MANGKAEMSSGAVLPRAKPAALLTRAELALAEMESREECVVKIAELRPRPCTDGEPRAFLKDCSSSCWSVKRNVTRPDVARSNLAPVAGARGGAPGLRASAFFSTLFGLGLTRAGVGAPELKAQPMRGSPTRGRNRIRWSCDGAGDGCD